MKKQLSKSEKLKLIKKLQKAKKETSLVLKSNLSETQRKMLFFELSSNVSNTISYFEIIERKIDIKKLKHCLNILFHQNKILHTQIKKDHNKYIQEIIETEPTFQHTNTYEGELDETIHKSLKDKIKTLNSPLFKIKLIETPNKTAIIFSFHHIIFDGWSLKIFLNELKSLYNEVSEEHSPTYVFSPKENPCLSSELKEIISKTHRNIEAKYLLGSPSKSKAFENHYITIKKNKKFKTNFSFNILHLTSFLILLSKYSDSPLANVFIPLLNRQTTKELQSIGPYMNPTFFGYLFKDASTIDSALNEISQQLFEYLKDQSILAETITNEIKELNNQSIDIPNTPLFIYQDETVLPKNIFGSKTLKRKTISSNTFHNLNFEVFENSERFLIKIHFNKLIHNIDMIEQLAEHYKLIYENVLKTKNTSVSEIQLLTEFEKNNIQKELINTETPFDETTKLHTLFENQASISKSKIALIENKKSITYAELNIAANKLACYLNKNLEKSSTVGIHMPLSINAIVSMLGILKAGHTYLPLDTSYPDERIHDFINRANPKLILYDSKKTNSKKIPEEAISEILNKNIKDLRYKTYNNSNCYSIFTSGSTGNPKKVIGSHKGTCNRVLWMNKVYPLTNESNCALRSPINFIDHFWEIFCPLSSGSTAFILEKEILISAKDTLKFLEKHNINRVTTVPALLNNLLKAPPEFFKKINLKEVFCGGEQLNSHLLNEFNKLLPDARLINIYGSTEVSADLTFYDTKEPKTPQTAQTLNHLKEVLELKTENLDLSFLNNIHTDKTSYTGTYLDSIESLDVRDFKTYLSYLNETIIPNIMPTQCPTYIGHMTRPVPEFLSFIESINIFLNQNMSQKESSGILIEVEKKCIEYLHKIFFKKFASFYKNSNTLGTITHSGTLANTFAIQTALFNTEIGKTIHREGLYNAISNSQFNNISVICSEVSHYSIVKACSSLGIGTNNVIQVETLDGKMSISDLNKKVSSEIKKGNLIAAIVANAGSTEFGSFDNLKEITKLCSKYKIHCHVDGAWGGPIIFSNKYKHLIHGIENADSISICGHKELLTPQSQSVCIFKENDKIPNPFTSNYQSRENSDDLSKTFLSGSRPSALSLHAALSIIGKNGYSHLIETSIEKRKKFQEHLSENFELLSVPDSNIILYRYIPDHLKHKETFSEEDSHEINAINSSIHAHFLNEKKYFVSKTISTNFKAYKGIKVVALRIVFYNYKASIETYLNALKLQEEFARYKGPERYNTSQYITESINHPVPVGKPIGNMKLFLLNKSFQQVPRYIIANVYASGTGISNCDLVETFNGHNILNMHDQGYLDKNYNLVITGRTSRLIKINGIRIQPEEIENQVINMLHVTDAQAYLLNNAIHLIVESNTTLEPEEIKKYLRSKLPEAYIPKNITLTDKIPLTPNGKKDINKIKKLAIKDKKESTQEKVIKNTKELSKKIEKAWRNTLQLDYAINTDKEFYELGNSLQLTSLLLNLEKEFKVDLSLSELIQNPSIQSQETLIATKKEATKTSPYTVTIKKSNPYNQTIFCFPPAGGQLEIYNELSNYIDPNFNLVGLQGNQKINVYKDFVKHFEQLVIQNSSSKDLIFIGHSFGGSLAFDVATSLKKQGYTIRGLCLIDTPLYQGKEKEKIKALNKTSFTRYLKEASPNTWNLVKDNPVFYMNWIKHLKMQLEFTPKASKIPIYYIFASEKLSSINFDTQNNWKKLYKKHPKNIHFFKNTGNHISIMEHPHINSLGKTISNIIKKC